MAPEQIQGKPRAASDQYALGIVYEWLTGRRPFSGTSVELAMQHIMTALKPLLSPSLQLLSKRGL